MDVNVIFQNECAIDEYNNFALEFKNQEEIIEIFFRKNRDYYLSNAIAFITNNYDKDIINLYEKVKAAKAAPHKFPYQQVGIDFRKTNLLSEIFNIHKYEIEATNTIYTKTVKYFDIEEEKLKEVQVYDWVGQLQDGVTYKSNKSIGICSTFEKIKFKLEGKKIEVRLFDSARKNLKLIYYYWLNTIFRYENGQWIGSDTDWFSQAYRVYTMLKNRSVFERNYHATKLIWYYFKNRPNSKVIMNNINWSKKPINSFPTILFKKESINFNDYYFVDLYRDKDYDLYVSPDSNYYLKRSYNILKDFQVEIVNLDKKLSSSPMKTLAKFRLTKSVKTRDFTQLWNINDNLDLKVKIDSPGPLKTIEFSGNNNSKIYTNLENDLNYYKIENNDFSDLTKTVKPSQHAFFWYENQNIIKETFVSELQKKVSLIGGLWDYILPGSGGKTELVTARNKLKFNMKQNTTLSKLDFGISPVIASQQIKFKQKKNKNLLIISTPLKTKKRKMKEVVETILIKALQNFDKYTVLNPLDIDIRSNYMTEKINNYKGYVYEILIRNLLFSASITNDTQQIFIVCYNLDSAKKALINGKLYSILGIINISEIKNWDKVKGKSIYVSVKFDDISSTVESATHFAFKFKTAFPTEIFEFKIELLDDQVKQIKFSADETKVPALDIQIDILK